MGIDDVLNSISDNFRKNKRTTSVADSKQNRPYNNSINMINLKKDNAHRYMSVTPSHKYHESKMGKLFSETSKAPLKGNVFLSTTHRIKPELSMNNLGQGAKFKGNTIEELKDEYNESKLSINNSEDNPNRELDLDLEALIIVEDKI